MSTPTLPGEPELRAAFGAFATGVCVLTTRDAEGCPQGMTVSSFAAVSLAPPLVLWCAQRGVQPFAAFEAAAHFAVHVLSADQQHLSDRFAWGEGNRFAGLAVEQGPNGLPLLPGCSARLLCETVERHAGGDHVIFLGRVFGLSHQPFEPLLYHGGAYGRLLRA
ncbi:MAG: flavin reductase family protein [Aquimonas sp.]|nr:flavin reductase family protein [Aquimonas sp.]